ncbi:tail fiber protein [Vibrio parahaemolyticus]|nr:tail fiber protein [Vibrio parahaemolyticus]
MSMYFSYVTNVGIDKIEAAYNAGETINLIEMAIGDSNGAYVAPDSSFTNLVNEFARVALNEASTDGHLIHVISYIQPTAETAEKTLREYGIYDDEGDMIIYGAYPESLIPSLASAEHLQLEVENITELENADVVNVTVSPIVPHATETEAGIAKIINVDDVEAGVDDSKILTISKMLKRVATSVKAGVARFATSAEAINGTDTSTMLNPSTGLALLKSRISSALDGTRTDYSASESALSQVNAKADNAQSTADSATDLANAAQATADSKWTAQDATTSQKGIVQLSDVVTSTSTALAATAKAVKTAYDKALAALNAANSAQATADSKWTAQDATTSQKGIVQLSDVVTSTSTALAATAKAVKTAYDKALAALNAANSAQATADSKWTAQNATTSQKGIMMLSHKTDGSDKTKSASEYALGLVNTKAQEALDDEKLHWVKVASGSCSIPWKNGTSGTLAGTIETGYSASSRKHYSGRFKVNILSNGTAESSDPTNCWWSFKGEPREVTYWSGTPQVVIDVYAYGAGLVSGTGGTSWELWELQA